MQPAVRICRESLLTESSRMILSGRKGATAPFSCLPARTGSGRARSWVKGWIPCGYSGQRPEPSESFSSSISTVFKVLLSLFFHGSFFIDYLTLPCYTAYYYRIKWKFCKSEVLGNGKQPGKSFIVRFLAFPGCADFIAYFLHPAGNPFRFSLLPFSLQPPLQPSQPPVPHVCQTDSE